MDFSEGLKTLGEWLTYLDQAEADLLAKQEKLGGEISPEQPLMMAEATTEPVVEQAPDEPDPAPIPTPVARPAATVPPSEGDPSSSDPA